jgi:hypothetical protein
MRAGRHEKRRILGVNVIEMDAQRDHAGEQVKWRLYVVHPTFDRPWPKASNILSFFDRDGSVLMPPEGPVCLRCFVEQDGADRTRKLAQDGCGDYANRPFPSQKQLKAGVSMDANTGFIGRIFTEYRIQLGKRGKRHSA